ncbi:MAG TPA: thiamine phosphate synthase [Beijerinckiaceae bacterium]|jgi:thiamine-phosphate pyrophosphorylase
MNPDASAYRLCLVTDRALAGGRPLVDVVAAAVAGGVTMVQLREKTATTRAFLEEARALKALLAPLGVPLVVNDRVDIALAVDADGVHVGQTDMPVEQVRALIGPGKLIGLSITNAEQMRREDSSRADYVGVGPLYLQQTKADASTPLGVDGFRALRALTTRPVMAIGGLKADNSAPVLAAGADGLAVVSGIVSAEDPRAAAARFAALFA